MPKPATVWLKQLDGVWTAAGTGLALGVPPESVVPEYDDYGAAKYSFEIHRDPSVPWPDIGAFTPVVLELGGLRCWSGRVQETPSRDDLVMSVQCEGMQYHLDDDQYERRYVSTKLSEWKDMRSVPTAVLGATFLLAAGQVSSDGGLLLSYPVATSQRFGMNVAAVLDLGPSSSAKRVVVTWSAWGAGGAAQRLIIRGSDLPDNTWPAGTFEDVFVGGTVAGPTTTAGTFTTARRYVQLILNYAGTDAVAAGVDVFVKITDVKVFADTAYESGNESILKASQVLNDALDRGTILLSPDRSQIDPDATITTSLPELAATEPQTPREMIAKANSIHGYQPMVDVYNRMVFRPRPSRPTMEAGAWSPMTVESQGSSGQEIYNRDIVVGQTPAGEPVRVSRSSSQLQGVATAPVASPTPDNPGFEVDTSSWSVTSGTITRTTVAGEFDSGVAGGKWTPGGGSPLSETFTGTFIAGRTYVVAARLRATTDLARSSVDFTVGVVGDLAPSRLDLSTAFATYAVAWTPTANRTGVILSLQAVNTFEGPYFIDNVTVSSGQPTLVDRRGFTRTKQVPISAALPSDQVLAEEIGDTWLAGHKTTPGRGTVTVKRGAIRERLTGRTMELEELGLRVGELVCFTDRVDPDTGGWGRSMRLVGVKLNNATDEATLTFDNARADFETLMARLDLAVGSS